MIQSTFTHKFTSNRSGSVPTITVVGGGLAGSECAFQLAELGYFVDLVEMRPVQSTAAHKTSNMAELVCSNSFGSYQETSAPGQLKWEASQMNSLILKMAEQSAVPAGQALAMDRDLFSQNITETLENHQRIRLQRKKIDRLEDLPRPCVLATGPLTDKDLALSLQNHLGSDYLYFFDAIAPIIDADSIDREVVWSASRFGHGTADYLNCPLNREQYYNFVSEIVSARKIEPKEFEKIPYFSGCMPIEVMAESGPDTLRFGPLSPKGLRWDRPDLFGVVQLRQDNQEATAYNMVGFQTKMAYGEQVRVFRMIPGLERAEFLKLGSIHRNLYVNSPLVLNADLSSRKDPWLFLAGQITGVEGYFESACVGLLAALFLHQRLTKSPFSPPPRHSALGAILTAITEKKENFQPTNINFGLFPRIAEKMAKKEKRKLQIANARKEFLNWKAKTTNDTIENPNKYSDIRP